MQTRFTAKGTAGDGKEVSLAFELLEEAFLVSLSIIPKAAFSNEQLSQWAAGETIQLPEGTVTVQPNLNEDSILPADIKSEETGKIRAKQNEWAYLLLTNKLWESYLIELETLKKQAAELTSYSRSLFDDAKGFWERVLEHKKERDISQSKLDEIKEEVNKIFEVLKGLRKNEGAQYEESSAKLRDEIFALIETFKTKLVEGAQFKELFEELKQMQLGIRGKRFTKADDNNIRKAFDAAFQQLNEARNSFASNKNASRVENLSKIVGSMEKSLQRDKADLDYYTKKINNPKANALEIQLVKLKLNMIQEAISSKEEKIADIHKTLEKLQQPKRKQAQVGNKPKASTTENTTDETVEDVAEETDAAEVIAIEESTPEVVETVTEETPSTEEPKA
jgi:hypothetical protein